METGVGGAYVELEVITESSVEAHLGSKRIVGGWQLIHKRLRILLPRRSP